MMQDIKTVDDLVRSLDYAQLLVLQKIRKLPHNSPVLDHLDKIIEDKLAWTRLAP